MTKLFAWGEEDSGGHVLYDTASRDVCVWTSLVFEVRPARTSERVGAGRVVRIRDPRPILAQYFCGGGQERGRQGLSAGGMRAAEGPGKVCVCLLLQYLFTKLFTRGKGVYECSTIPIT